MLDLDRFIDLYKLHRFCRARTSEDKRSYNTDKITGESVKYQESLINTSSGCPAALLLKKKIGK